MFKLIYFHIHLVIDEKSISCENPLRFMSLGLADSTSTLVQVMAWYYKALNNYLVQCGPICMSPYGITLATVC